MNLLRTQDPLTYDIIGAAIAVHRELGPGLLEGVYEEALCIELSDQGFRFERQRRVDVVYKGKRIGDMYADVVVANEVILELKSVKQLDAVHFAQLMTYMKLMKLRKGLLINFNVALLIDGVKRAVL